MPLWMVSCPNCGQETETPATVAVLCGQVSCDCTCPSCRHTFRAEQEWWRWAGLDEGPPQEPAELAR